ncbi:FixH family protein [Halobacillus sp. ACCC02827]|uniref:FixH family protein n=1 Tax=Halobacillus sp. ACCC02827 TaxID=3052090 RepID=UPI002570814C|nr:FixH family protein [Halobacillus sp. ACCC02827]WJE17207.1 FixH family protein [Halobacillus sp. ACCC02827]
MKKTIIMVLLIFPTVLTGCSLKEDAASLYKTETPLAADIHLPNSIQPDEEEAITIDLTQNGRPAADPDYVHYEIWKDDGSVSYPMKEARRVEAGVYSIDMTFKSDGLYHIKLHAESDGSTIVPQKQFVVGELTEEDRQSLEDGSSKEPSSSGHHH